MIRALIGLGSEPEYLGVATAPEIMAYARSGSRTDGFIYITASHNPVGHNGVKFGLSSGGVLDGHESERLRERYLAGLSASMAGEEIRRLVSSADPARVASVYERIGACKERALTAYREFARRVVTGGGSESDVKRLFTRLCGDIGSRSPGILAELNGSARCLSIDESFFSELGAKVRVLNGAPGQIVHPIIPEGESLRPCALALEEAHREDPSFVLGYVPDNDGDRGNIVIVDPSDGKARVLDAQQVFALACVSELAWLVYSGEVSYSAEGRAEQRVAVAVNGPTSLRIDRIADAFDAKVFRCEVGEANVVSLAAALRKKGYLVRILGEGSNGGNITHPSAVRDPLATVASILKLLSVQSRRGRPGPFEIWCRRSGQPERFKRDFTLADILSSLPDFVTTPTSEERARMKIRTPDHAVLKQNYEAVFRREWDREHERLSERYDIRSWDIISYDGMSEIHGTGKAGKRNRGGMKILFKNGSGDHMAFIWMRGSGTEPVFRLLADVASPRSEDEADLLAWHARMIREADAAGI